MLIETRQTRPLYCPNCYSTNVRRSRRRSLADYLYYGLAGVLPWRCKASELRFHARHVPLRHLLYAHCRICGNQELQRISGEYVPGAAAFLGRLLGVRALRCAPCRNKFFSIRPMLRDSCVALQAAGQ